MQVFKHHLSVVEGHQRMIDMIRKHTVEGTENHKIITECMRRADTMLKDTKTATRSFVHDSNDRNNVPLGSASDSMYVGYSPADHEYGEAANHYGQQMAQARKNGADATNGKKPTKNDHAASKYSSGANGVPVAERKVEEPEPVEEREELVQPAKERKAAHVPEVEPNTFFFVDAEPAPAQSSKLSKRGQTDDAGRPSKKSKVKPDLDTTVIEGETEDISAEVDARLAEKARKRQEKKENKDKKRKRDSNGSAEAEEPKLRDADKMDLDEVDDKPEKPKKKKSKKTKDEAADELVEDVGEPKADKSKKKDKKAKDATSNKKRESDANVADEPKAKKSKKSKKEKKDEA